ncbi:hypothetical protein [Arthrobacter ruber]|uniref:hypothetical protein n=1 Tax=Arthrobacter ruber TaxID=1258893 RepID=UPI000CF38594|nr:hypothetical protein [Arthrobacter ruber]
MSRLTTVAAERHVLLSGSLLAVLPEKRLAAAEYLAQHNHWVHVDVIEGTFRGQAGISLTELEHLTTVRHVLDIHLMVDDPADIIPRLPVRPRRLTIQIRDLSDVAHLMKVGRIAASEVWIAVEEVTPRHVVHLTELEPDGVLVMLTPPGSPGHAADIDRLAHVRLIHSAQLQVGVDGGITGDNLGQAADSGITYAVSGRAFFDELHQEAPHGSSVTQ